MGFDNSQPFPNRHDRRKPYRGAKAVCGSCRNHGGCPWCEGNRLHAGKLRVMAAIERIKGYLRGDD